MPENAQGLERQAAYADSMEAAAGALGRSAEFLQRLKGMGCPAFRGSRVYVEEVESYILDNNLQGLEREIEAALGVDVEIQKERLRKLRFANDVFEGKYLLKADLAALVLELGMQLNGVLQEKLEDMGPDRLAMKTRDELVPITKAMRDEICDKFQEDTDKWSRT